MKTSSLLEKIHAKAINKLGLCSFLYITCSENQMNGSQTTYSINYMMTAHSNQFKHIEKFFFEEYKYISRNPGQDISVGSGRASAQEAGGSEVNLFPDSQRS